ncbi:Condensin complex subunit [Serendipita sp. 399]|nr:Condensin complex subunit [Serendipita sp. 399]
MNTHKAALEMYAFLLLWVVGVGEKVSAVEEEGAAATTKGKRTTTKGGKAAASTKPAKKKTSTWQWVDQVPSVLSLITKVLKTLPSNRVWTTTAERDGFIGVITRPAYQIAESEAFMKIEKIKAGVYKSICVAVKGHGHGFAFQISLLQSLQYFEHLSEPMAEILDVLDKEFDVSGVGDEVLREIAQKTFSAVDTKGPRTYGKFLMHLGELCPKIVLKQMSLLMDQVDSEVRLHRPHIPAQLTAAYKAYPMRIAMVEIIGHLIKYLAGADQVEKREKKINSLFDMLAERYMDVSSYVRVKVMQVLSRVWDLPQKFPKQRLIMTANTITALHDKTPSSSYPKHFLLMAAENSSPAKTKKKKKPRKSEQVNLHAVSQEQVLVAEMEGTQIVHLKLRKRYYAEALDFIRWLDQGSETVGELLGSTHKTEVLEAMEFFRVSYEYGMDSAPLGLKKMLHLIWSKDNASTSEDGKELKGIRAKLLECYRSIYFDPVPDLEPRQQVNRITKNMIEYVRWLDFRMYADPYARLTFDATVAELTSLEEMLRAMMDDGQIPNEVIKRLWQVYSADKEIPRNQRRGAIIVLGMIAAARREVVNDRADTLIRIGLVLAKFTCIALQRLSGTVKKVKGSLDDKSVRLSVDSPVFAKLQDIIESTGRSQDWFGMAEQAINAIYLLGEQPDVICDTIIKRLAARVFEAPRAAAVPEEAAPEDEGMEIENTSMITDATSSKLSQMEGDDMGDAFLLSQLVFVVGHVAIKHLVYLELVEREMKRRKDVAAKEKGHNASSPAPSKDGEELDQVAGSAEDEIGDLIASVREDEMMFSPTSLLATFGPMITHICLNPPMFKHQVLRTSAALSLSKLMCISSKFCEENLLLLLRMLETSRDPNIRSNIVIALGDIAVCFSTLIDENSDRLYKGLSDQDLTVKKNTLMVLTHLILNGMVKVKGQLGEMAKCLEDEDRRVSDLAKLFFTELSTKDNAIYNNIQDVISHLSVGPHAVDEEVFQSTMKYIFNFIEKEKQAENLVEKLCQRFRDTTDEKQWRNIAFCLSLLPYKSERSLKKLIEALPFYQDKLREQTVYERFTEILQKARTNKSANKPDSEMKEFEKILSDFKEQGQEDQALEKRVEIKKAVAKRRAVRRDGDGGAGGVRPLSQIKILRSIVRNVHIARSVQNGQNGGPAEQELDGMKPCEHFDLIVGTGTGGLLAVLVGRLQLTLGELEEAYREFAETVYGQSKMDKWWSILSTSRYRPVDVENVMNKWIKESLLDEECRVCDMCSDEGHAVLMREKQTGDRVCRVAVTATSMANTQSCRLIRSYSSLKHRLSNLTIVEAIRATTASYLKFPPVLCDGEWFISAAEAGYNNPALLAKEEVTEGIAFNSASVQCLVRIGSGTRQPNTLVHPSPSAFWMSVKQHVIGDVPLLLRPLSMMASDSETVRDGLQKDRQLHPNGQSIYFDFDVNLAQWDVGKWSLEAAQLVNAQSEDYLNRPEILGRMQIVADFLTAQ